MAENPVNDWTIDDLVKVAGQVGLLWRAPSGGSHYTFSSPYSAMIETVPYKRPIKAPYIRKFVALAKRHRAAEGEANER
jgi:hypothetical protein